MSSLFYTFEEVTSKYATTSHTFGIYLDILREKKWEVTIVNYLSPNCSGHVHILLIFHLHFAYRLFAYIKKRRVFDIL